ncbi:MAG: hypothetical protein EOO88_18905 [Pedobacter sp.]|nr:MAG: hypothetical protein EOO88_18905 [Pedobacter sp.]
MEESSNSPLVAQRHSLPARQDESSLMSVPKTYSKDVSMFLSFMGTSAMYYYGVLGDSLSEF